MKNILGILIFTALIIGCQEEKKQTLDEIIEGGNLMEIRKKKQMVSAELKQIKAEIKKLETVIDELDTVEKIPLITTFKAKKELFNHYLEIQGNVDTKDNLIISPEYSGILTQVFVKEGQKVTKGQTLAKIDDGGLTQQLAQLNIQSELAKTTYERQQRLWDNKIGSEMDFLSAKSNYEAQIEVINHLKIQMKKTVVVAPFSGIIDDVITEQGSVVAAGQSPLMRIINLNNMYIETDVPESHIMNVTKGKKVTVEFPILGKSIETKIRQAGNFINPVNRTFKIEIAIPNRDKKIKPNLTAKLKINDYKNDEAILIPQSIISENASGEQYLYIVKDRTTENKATVVRKIITTGFTQGDVIEVLSGINDRDEIIMEGARTVEIDQTVEIISNMNNK